MVLGKLLSEVHYHLQGTRLEQIPGATTTYRTLVSLSGETVVHGDIRLTSISETETHYAKGYEEPVVSLFKGIINPGDAVLELGCSIGYFTTLFSRLTGPSGEVVGYEPNVRRYEVLTQNLDRNDCDNVTTYNLAVGEYQDTGVLSSNDGDNSSTVVKLDNHLSWEPDIVKIDIEGAEIGALLGFSNKLRNAGPTIVCEVHPEKINHYGHSINDLNEFLENHGYEIYQITPESVNPSMIDSRSRAHYLFKP